MAFVAGVRPAPSTAQQPPPVSKALENTPEVHLARAHDAFNQHRMRLAEREFRAALALDPKLTVQARFPLAVVLFGLQDRDEARKQFEIVRATTGDDPNVSYYLGRLDLMDGNLQSAIHNLTIAVSKPPFPDADYYLGYAYFKNKNDALAEKWLKEAVILAPRDARVYEHLGLLYLAMRRKEEAEKAFAQASELRREDITATRELLDCGRALSTEPLEMARVVCQKLNDPNDAASLVSLGTLYGQHQDYADAIAPFQLAAKLDPDSYVMQYNLGLTYFRLKRYADARGPLEKAVALRPDIFEVNAPLGAVLYALGNDSEAYRILDHANRLNPQNSDVASLLCKEAMILSRRSREEHNTLKAQAYLERAVEACPGNPEPHRQLAEIYGSSGKQAAAQREREEADRLSSH
jgi:tetratricopeptide (TPR) repeat protein